MNSQVYYLIYVGSQPALGADIDIPTLRFKETSLSSIPANDNHSVLTSKYITKLRARVASRLCRRLGFVPGSTSLFKARQKYRTATMSTFTNTISLPVAPGVSSVNIPRFGLGVYESEGRDCYNSVLWALEVRLYCSPNLTEELFHR